MNSFFFQAFFWAIAIPSFLLGQNATITLSDDEVLFFFPGYSYRDTATGSFMLHVHGWVFEPEPDSRLRKKMLSFLGKQLGGKLSINEKTLLEKHGFRIMADQEKGKRIGITLGEKVFDIGVTNANGHAIKSITLPESFSLKVTKAGKVPLWIHFSALSGGKEKRSFQGRAMIIPPRGVSIITDIDDTIKMSNVLDKKELLRNTFLRPYRAVPGMARLFAAWRVRGAVFHYVTASPWQIYESLAGFIADNGFPEGVFHMRSFGFPFNFTSLLDPADTVKIPHITSLMERFPLHRFILVGDSGERDPEIYGEIARRFPGRVIAIYIRNVGNERRDSPRLSAAFRDIGTTLWMLFENADAVSGEVAW